MEKNKIELTIKVSPAEVEMANYCISRFLTELKSDSSFREALKITEVDMTDGERFRTELLNQLFNYGN